MGNHAALRWRRWSQVKRKPDDARAVLIHSRIFAGLYGLARLGRLGQRPVVDEGVSLVRERSAGNPPAAFDERDVETEATAEPLRHRQTKGTETDMFSLPSPRHISTLRNFALFGWPRRSGIG